MMFKNKEFLLNSLKLFNYANKKLTNQKQARFLNEAPKTNSSSFFNYLQTKIKMKGPITVAEYMKEALGNPKWV